jgi:hypothetical protein
MACIKPTNDITSKPQPHGAAQAAAVAAPAAASASQAGPAEATVQAARAALRSAADQVATATEKASVNAAVRRADAAVAAARRAKAPPEMLRRLERDATHLRTTAQQLGSDTKTISEKWGDEPVWATAVGIEGAPDRDITFKQATNGEWLAAAGHLEFEDKRTGEVRVGDIQPHVPHEHGKGSQIFHTVVEEHGSPKRPSWWDDASDVLQHDYGDGLPAA